MDTALLDALVTEFEQIHIDRVEAPTPDQIKGWADDLHKEFSLTDEEREELYLRLRTHGRVTQDDVEAVENREVQQIAAGQGVRRKDMTPAERRAHDRATARRRMSAYRKRTRKDAENVERAKQPLDPVRMRFSLQAVALIMDLVEKVVTARYNKVRRVLGDVYVGDIASETVIGLAEGMARSDHRVESLIIAADWLSKQPGIPEVPVEAPVGAKFIMSVLMRQATVQIANNYRQNVVRVESMELRQDPTTGEWKEMLVVKDVTLASLEYLDTILSSQYMGGIDTLIANSKADGGLSMVGTKFQIPGEPNRLFARQIIDSAITARGLDWLTDMLLDDENVRSDGTFKWAENADTIIETMLKVDPRQVSDDARVRRDLAQRITKRAYQYLLDVVYAARGLSSDPRVLVEVTGGEHHPVPRIMAAAERAMAVEEMDLLGDRQWQYHSVARLEEVVKITDDPQKLMREKARIAALAIEEILG